MFKAKYEKKGMGLGKELRVEILNAENRDYNLPPIPPMNKGCLVLGGEIVIIVMGDTNSTSCI